MHSYLWRRHFQAYNDREWYITGLASLIVTIFGLMGNMTTCLVFIQQKMMDAFNQLLIALASIDILFLLFSSITSITITMQYDPGYEPGTYIRSNQSFTDHYTKNVYITTYVEIFISFAK